MNPSICPRCQSTNIRYAWFDAAKTPFTTRDFPDYCECRDCERLWPFVLIERRYENVQVAHA